MSNITITPVAPRPVVLDVGRMAHAVHDIATQSDYAAVSIENSYGALLGSLRNKGSKGSK